MRQFTDVAAVVRWTTGFALVGCLVGELVLSVCWWSGLVRPEVYSALSGVGGVSASVGALTGGLLGFGWSAQDCCRRLAPVAEDESW